METQNHTNYEARCRVARVSSPRSAKVGLDAIEKKDVGALTALAFDDGTQPFDAQDAKDILARLAEPKVRYALR